jgi:transposase-like protein
MKRGRKPKCPYCGSSQTIHKGSRPTVTLGKRPLGVCKSCKRKFTIRTGNKLQAAPAVAQPLAVPA